ncbi:hypothetical protein FLBR109950_02420 [Flavobacterium branchiophilum]
MKNKNNIFVSKNKIKNGKNSFAQIRFKGAC